MPSPAMIALRMRRVRESVTPQRARDACSQSPPLVRSANDDNHASYSASIQEAGLALSFESRRRRQTRSGRSTGCASGTGWMTGSSRPKRLARSSPVSRRTRVAPALRSTRAQASRGDGSARRIGNPTLRSTRVTPSLRADRRSLSRSRGPSPHLYTSLETDAVVKYQDVARKDLPDLEINIIRLSTGDLGARMKAEQSNPQADVIWGWAVTNMEQFIPMGMLEPYRAKGIEKLDKRFVHPKDMYAGIDMYIAAFCVNTKVLKEKNLPSAEGMVRSPQPGIQRARRYARPAPPERVTCRLRASSDGKPSQAEGTVGNSLRIGTRIWGSILRVVQGLQR